MEQILAIGRAELVQLAGEGCEAERDVVARFAFRLATAREARRAQLHLATCPRCGAMYERLDLWREKVAALLPVPPVVEAHGHVVERVVHVGTELVSGASPRVAESPGGLRGHVTGTLAQLREHATSAYYRTVDPTPLAGVRPGALAAAVAGCLAVGGGATYCVREGADPIRVLTDLAASAHHPKQTPHSKRARAAQAPAPPVITPAATPPPAPQPPAQAPATLPPPLPPPAPEDQFEPGNAGGNAPAAAQAASSTTAKPAPAPADGPGEFDGP